MSKFLLGSVTDPSGYDSSGVTAGMTPSDILSQSGVTTPTTDTTGSSSSSPSGSGSSASGGQTADAPTDTPDNAPQIVEPSTSSNSTFMYLGLGILLFLAFKKKLMK